MRRIIIELLLTICMANAVPTPGLAAEAGWNEAGVRIGIQASPNRAYLRQYEAFAAYELPWDWRGASGWGLKQHAVVSLGVLDTNRETGLIGSVGTALILNKTGSGFTSDLGITANLLDRRQINSIDFGSILQFGAYIGINYCFNNKLKIGYRLQHISNGHIIYAEETPNPGLDMHMIGISYAY